MEQQTKFINAYFWITCKDYLKYGQPLLLRWILLGYKCNNLEELFRTKAKRVVSGGGMWWFLPPLLGGRSASRVRHQEAVKASSNLSSNQQPLKQAKTSQASTKPLFRPFLKPSAHAAQPLWEAPCHLSNMFTLSKSNSANSNVSDSQILGKDNSLCLFVCFLFTH